MSRQKKEKEPGFKTRLVLAGLTLSGMCILFSLNPVLTPLQSFTCNLSSFFGFSGIIIEYFNGRSKITIILDVGFYVTFAIAMMLLAIGQ